MKSLSDIGVQIQVKDFKFTTKPHLSFEIYLLKNILKNIKILIEILKERKKQEKV